MERPIKFAGAIASPYTQKMLALLRYRRIPHTPIWGQPQTVCEQLGVEAPKPALMPTFFFEESGVLSAVCDSTPIIRRLEEMAEERSVIPDDPALAFIDYLLEDFADEWGTKYMFHYRWHSSIDADNAGTLLPLHFDVSMASEQLTAFKHAFSERQINRLYVVGSNETTAPIIDRSYRRFLQALDQHLAQQRFMLGERPGAGDFALFGQLTQLVGFDPTPRAIAHETSPRTVAWVDLLRDQSGLEPKSEGWLLLESQPDSLKALLSEIGRTYAPAQLANAKAVENEQKEWRCEIDGAEWVQPTFPYQAKCLRNTRQLYAALSGADRKRIDDYLNGTGVEIMLADRPV